jgi:hypothetical protein
MGSIWRHTQDIRYFRFDCSSYWSTGDSDAAQSSQRKKELNSATIRYEKLKIDKEKQKTNNSTGNKELLHENPDIFINKHIIFCNPERHRLSLALQTRKKI